MKLILAQSTDLPSVPAETLKWVLIIIVTLIIIAAITVGAWAAVFRKSPATKIDDNPPVEIRKAPKRYNHDATEQRFVSVERRVGVLEDWRTEQTGDLLEMEKEIIREGKEREERLTGKIQAVSDALDDKHEKNESKIARINWMLARVCERLSIKVPEEGEKI
jgi:hypothetical protein